MEQIYSLHLVPQAHLGFFSKPMAISDSRVLKKYTLRKDKQAIEKIQAAHKSFLTDFRNIGINIPNTVGEIVPLGNNKYTFQIIQARFPKEKLAGEMVKTGSEKIVLMVLEKIIDDACKYLNSPLLGERGFHPTLRNYAFSRQMEAYMIDTFPPYTTREETKKMMIAASPNLLAKLGIKYSKYLANHFTKEYYDGQEMISGITKTIARMRPDLQNESKALTLKLAEKNTPNLKKQIEENLSNHKQSLIWKIAHKTYV